MQPSTADNPVSTGIPFLDSLMGGLFIGDNVIWYDDAGSLAGVFCLNFLRSSQIQEKDVIYVCFDRSPRNLLDKLGGLADYNRLTIIDCFTHGKGDGSPVFMGFYDQQSKQTRCRIHRMERPADPDAVMDLCYSVHAGLHGDVRFIFESLTGMQELWRGEEHLLNFYAHSCPRLYELNTVAYWMIEKKAHSSRLRAQINQIAQVVIELSVKRGKTSLAMVKAEKRHIDRSLSHQDYWTRDNQVVFDSEKHVPNRVELGMRIKELRTRKGMSQTELARQIGVTPSTISQVESNLIYPSVPGLLKMAEILGSSPGQLLEDAVSPGHRILFSSSSALEITIGESHRDAISGWHLTASKPEARAHVYRIDIHSKARVPRHFLTHKGSEIGYLISGELRMTLPSAVISIEVGDLVYLDKETPSLWENPGTETARLLWITS